VTDTRRCLAGRQQGDFVGCAAEFERAGVLEVLQLEERAVPRLDRRFAHIRPESLIRRENGGMHA
jgi:hypothetical protein